MTTHRIEPVAGNVHGCFSHELAPILTIDPGDTVIFRTLDAGWGLEAPHLDGSKRKRLEAPGKEHTGHALCGPVTVRGAEVGMTLEVQIKRIVPGVYGWSSAGWGWKRGLHKKLGLPKEYKQHIWTLDAKTMTGKSHLGHTLDLHPFMGVMGVAPAEPGTHGTAPPRVTGGNMDCKDLVAGSTLYLPIAVKGALFSVGDGHGVQGHGEISGVAIECPMAQVELTFHLHDDMPIGSPRANTPKGWISLGFHKDLDEALWPALNGILDILLEQYKVSRLDALALASLVVDVHVTQVVNGVRGVHALLPHGVIRM
jgi:acetamidase/formamidase